MWARLPATLLLTASAALTACTPGQTEFSCKGHPDGVACISARDVYDLTNSRSRVTQADLENPAVINGSAAQDILKPLPNSDPRLDLAPAIQSGQQAADPAAGVMRVWVGPHVTSGGDVAAPNYVYSRIDDNGVAVSPAGIERRFEPLTGQSAPNPALNARPLESGDLVVTKATPHIYDPVTAKNVDVADIYFESGRADISADGHRKLEAAAKKIATLNPKMVLVAGYTDTIGSKEANKKLAARRAAAVAKHLKELGVTAEIADTTEIEVEHLGKDPEAVADPNRRRVWVVALDVEQRPAPVAKVASDKPTDAAGTKKEVKQAGRKKNNGHPARLCRLCRDPDDSGSASDHGGPDHDNGMHH